nr:thioesterase [Bacteroidales bacterium]
AINFLMVDTEMHRPVRISPDFIKIEVRSDSVFESMPGKINIENSLHPSSVHTVRYSDLDIVGHVNNVKYIEWCTDVLDSELLINKGVADFEINFMSEAKSGEKVEISTSEMKDSVVWLSGKNLVTEKECFRAKITF